MKRLLLDTNAFLYWTVVLLTGAPASADPTPAGCSQTRAYREAEWDPVKREPACQLFGDAGILDIGTGKYPSTTTLIASMLVASFLIAAGFVLSRAVSEAQDDGTPRRRWPLLRGGPVRILVLLAIASLATLFYRLGPLGLAIVAVTLGRLGNPSSEKAT